ncbi:MAG: hypothetical protein KDI32_03180 [Pseudomonadales bacterium]|jgi:hypothetical protein|nr:hypothetical protein [Pseudomonadales bacterium]
MNATSASGTRHRIQKGRRAVPGSDPRIDTLLNMLMALTSEVAILRERLDAHERLAALRQFTGPDAVDAYQPDEEAQETRARLRERLIAKVCRPLVADGVVDQ